MVWACTSSDVVLVGEAKSGLYFHGLLCRVSLYVQPFVTFSFRVFLCFVLGLSFDFFVFYLVLKKLDGGFQKKILKSGFNLGLIRFGYRGTFFLNHDISLWNCGVSKLRWLV